MSQNILYNHARKSTIIEQSHQSAHLLKCGGTYQASDTTDLVAIKVPHFLRIERLVAVQIAAAKPVVDREDQRRPRWLGSCYTQSPLRKTYYYNKTKHATK